MEGGYLAVARLRKPHGLKGEVVAWSLTDEPEAVFAPGRTLVPVDEQGRAVGEPLVVERSRPYHRQWLLKFVDVTDRSVLDGWRQRLLGVPREALRQPADGEFYMHEIPGVRVRVGSHDVGVAVELLDIPGGGRVLAVDVGGHEVLVPFRPPIVRRVDRAARVIDLDPPPGLLEL